jgi:beta-glucanase (GH16 family)
MPPRSIVERSVNVTRARRSLIGVAGLCALLAVFATTATASGGAKHKHKHHANRGPSGMAMPVGNQPGWKQVLADNFTGTQLDSKWNKYNGVVGGNLGGWWSRSHTVVSGGELILKTYSDPPKCTDAAICPLFNNEVSGGIKSKLSLTYGKVLVRVKTTPVADDTFLGLLYPTSDIAPPETDFIVDGGPLNLTTIGAFLKFGTPINVVADSVTANAAQWHTLGVIWSPGEVQYTIDGSVWATESNPNVSTVPMNIVLQSQTDCEAVTGQTCSVPWAATEPNVDVDWVVAYTHK